MQTALTYRTNRDLFSNYYLDEHLPETEAWDEIDEEVLQNAREDILELWEREKSTAPNRNESQLEEKFVRPMFRLLDIPFEVEESTSRTQRRPDYGFFESENAARNAFERREEGGDFYEDAVAVADAKRWGRPLDTRGSGEHERDFENPSYQIHVYLQETPARWAVLTDGKKWRLYYGPTSHRLDSYYEVDLPTVLEKGDLEDFKYFYLFFRHEAFLEDASGDSFLDDVYDESNVFAQELGEDLQDNIYEAIKILSEGFLEYPENDLSADDLGLVHDSSLIYLYRLIFVLYAEAEGRELLDTDNEIYEDSYSLNSLKQDVAEELDSASPKYQPWQTKLWSRLDELFKLIDQGSESRGIPEDDLHIPAYNGGLFRTAPDEDDSPEARFLANYEVGDAYLARVVELLTRSQNGGGKIFVDYSSLDVRHLGSVYEGLLEYQLNVADEPLALEDGEYVSAGDGDEVAVEEGEVYLTTDSGERKATGSYYTPEYVVEYIVENTLGPLVTEIREDLMASSARGEERGFAAEFAERVFQLKVLDPAMGSGHFLTNAVDFLAREIIDAQERQAAQQGIETVDESHDINWARRQVAQRCIYGVDLNPLAVELAKVSLWLRTLAAEQPLAFLNHHLKTGNSLVGSDIETVLDNGDPDDETEDGQLTLHQSFDRTRRQALDHVTDRFQELLAIDNETLADVKEMEAVFEEVRDDPLYRHLLAMANVHTADAFGLDVPSDAYERMAAALRDDSWEEVGGQDWFASAQSMAADERFFHWELEFPVAFYGQDGVRDEDAGFDAVIGNPPYMGTKYLSDEQRSYYKKVYTSSTGKWDLYCLFTERGITLTRRKMSFIEPTMFMRRDYGKGLRDVIAKKAFVSEIVDLSEINVFDGATNYVCIITLTKSQVAEFPVWTILEREEFLNKIRTREYSLQNSELGRDPWPIVQPTVAQIQEGLPSEFVTLDSITKSISEGIKTGLNEAFVVTHQQANEENIESSVLKSFLKGRDVERYKISGTELLCIYPYSDGNSLSERDLSNKYPNAYDHLKQYESNLKSRPSVGPNGRQWFELEREREPDIYRSPKILTPDIAAKNSFALDRDAELYFNTKIKSIRLSDDTNIEYGGLLAILNSKLMTFIYRGISPPKRGGYRAYKPAVIRKLKVPNESIRDLAEYGDEMVDLRNRRSDVNLSLLDYLGNYADGPDLPDVGLFQPASTNILDSTTEDHEKLRLGSVKTERTGSTVTIYATARYKPENEDEHETDRWGYTETDYLEAFTLTDLSENEAALVEAFVPVAVEEGDGFADFRDNATKTTSLLDRLKAITLPDSDDIADDVRRYTETKARADELDEKIEKTDRLIDEIVYELYGLTEEEIEIVESSV